MKVILSLATAFFGSGAAATTPLDLIKINPVVAHIHVLQELKEKFEVPYVPAKPASKVPTSQHIKAAEKNKWENMWGWDPKESLDAYKHEYKDLIKKIIEREHQYCNEYYVFYHAQSKNFRVLQDFLKEIYALIGITSPFKEFEFLRIRHLAETFFDQNSFIDKHEGAQLGLATWNDTDPEMIKNMICVNIALFGNLSFAGEQTFHYFKHSQSLAGLWVLDSITKQLFIDFGFDQKYIQALNELGAMVSTNDGNLFQIFVPKDKVDQYVYLSHSYGTPYRNVIEGSVYDHTRKRHTKISKVLDAYIKDPSSIKDFDLLQARMLLSQDGILNPESGVKIFRYITADDKAVQKYKKAVKELASKIFSEALKNKTFKNIKNTRFNKLLGYIKAK